MDPPLAPNRLQAFVKLKDWITIAISTRLRQSLLQYDHVAIERPFIEYSLRDVFRNGSSCVAIVDDSGRRLWRT